MNNNILIPISKKSPDFWENITSLLLQEYKSEKFKVALDNLFVIALKEFKDKKEQSEEMPYHKGYIIKDEIFQFHYFVQMIAQNESQRDVLPMPIITAVKPFANDSYYVFYIHNIGNDNVDEINVFSWHVFNRYASRSFRLDCDITLPNTFGHIRQPQQGEEEIIKDNEFITLFKLVGKFFARNKVKIMGNNKSAYSEEEQKKESDDWLYSVWNDGITYCESVNESSTKSPRVFFHHTFLPYFIDLSVKDDACLDKNQLSTIAPDFNKLLNEEKKLYPLQYGDFTFDKRTNIECHKKLFYGIRDMNISAIQDYAWKYLFYFEKKSYITIDRDKRQPPKFDNKQLGNAKKEIFNFINDCNAIDESAIAQNTLCVCSELWWLLREFEEWDKKSVQKIKEEEGFRFLRFLHGYNVAYNIKKDVYILSNLYPYLEKIIDNNK